MDTQMHSKRNTPRGGRVLTRKSRLSIAVLALGVAVSLSACTAGPAGGEPTGGAASTAPTSGSSSSPSTPAPLESGQSESSAGSGVATQFPDSITAAADLLQQRYDAVKAGDYESACALYSVEYAASFAELAEYEGYSCPEAHEKAALNAETYLTTAAEQDRAGLMPFFYVPSAIEIDRSKISSAEEGVAFLAPGTVVNLDPTEFEDGSGNVPGWMGSGYVKEDSRGDWKFINVNESSR